MSAFGSLNFSQFKDRGLSNLSSIPRGIIPAGSVGLTYHHWKSPEAVDFSNATSSVALPEPKIEHVPISSLHTTQPGVYRRHVKRYLNRKTPVKEFPQVSRYKGQNWVEDGTHRTAAFHLGGAQVIPAMVREYE